MKYTRYLLLIAIVVTVGLSACQNKSEAKLDPCTELDQVDKEMLDLLESIKTMHKSEEFFQKRFEMSQVYWIQYRNRHIRALYPKDWDRNYRKEYGKEVFNSCKCKDLIRMTKMRIEELNMWIDGGPSNQKECPSSWN